MIPEDKKLLSTEQVEEDKQSNVSHVERKLSDLDTNNSTRKEYVVCTDPETFKQYRIDLTQNDIIVDDCKCPEELTKNVLKHYEMLKKMLKMPNFKWVYEESAEVNRYRKRLLPYKYIYFTDNRSLLNEEASNYPVYIYQSELSKAFSDKVDIDVEIDLLEYKDSFPATCNNLVIKFKESLVTSFNEVVKNLRRRVYKDYRVKLKPSADYQFVLKADGYRDYLRGNDSLLAYERVRVALRKKEILKLILTEIPKTNEKQKFPPILKLTPYEKIDFTDISSISPLFWYPYHKIGDNLETKNRNVLRISSGNLIRYSKSKPRFNFANSRKLFNKDPASLSEHLLVLNSGQCNFRFRFKVVGIENVGLIFNELTNPVATYNGKATPSNITLPSQLKSKTSILISFTIGELFEGSYVKVPSVLWNRSYDEALPLDSPFSTYMTYKPIFEKYCEKKEFLFVPFALYLKIEIYYGCQKLSKAKFTRKVPFNTSVIFNEWIEFTSVRVLYNLPIVLPITKECTVNN